MSASLVAVLVRPARPANVGAAARALKNFGFSELRLVGSREALPGGSGHGEARALAWNAAEILETASCFPSLAEAVADLHLVAAATARADAGGEIVSPRAFAEEAASLARGSRVGCVFGPEDHGLSNEELDLCRLRLRIPTLGEQPSLNLAQAVVLVAYETGLALAARPPEGASSSPEDAATTPRGAGAGREGSAVDGSEPATEGEIQRLSELSLSLGLRAGFFNPQAPGHVAGELRRLLARARPTSREVTLLLGLVAQLDWARRNPPD